MPMPVVEAVRECYLGTIAGILVPCKERGSLCTFLYSGPLSINMAGFGAGSSDRPSYCFQQIAKLGAWSVDPCVFAA